MVESFFFVSMSTISSFPFKANFRGLKATMFYFLASASVISPLFSIRALRATSIILASVFILGISPSFGITLKDCFSGAKILLGSFD